MGLLGAALLFLLQRRWAASANPVAAAINPAQPPPRSQMYQASIKRIRSAMPSARKLGFFLVDIGVFTNLILQRAVLLMGKTAPNFV